MRLIAALILSLVALPVSAAELRVLCTGASRAIVEAMAKQFESASGHKVVLTSDTAGGATRRVLAGEQYDVIMIVPAAIDDLATRG